MCGAPLRISSEAALPWHPERSRRICPVAAVLWWHRRRVRGQVLRSAAQNDKWGSEGSPLRDHMSGAPLRISSEGALPCHPERSRRICPVAAVTFERDGFESGSQFEGC